jgi:hypothetical protein
MRDHPAPILATSALTLLGLDASVATPFSHGELGTLQDLRDLLRRIEILGGALVNERLKKAFNPIELFEHSVNAVRRRTGIAQIRIHGVSP